MIADRLRVLMVIPNLDFGGAQTSFARLSKLLAQFVELKLVVFNRDNIAPLELHGELLDLQVNAGSNVLMKAVNFLRRISRLRKIKRAFRPHVAISFLEGADFINVMSAGSEKVFLYLHGSKTHDKNLTGLNRFVSRKIFTRLLYRKADKILVVNDRLRVEMITDFNLSGRSFHVLPNFYDITELKKMSEEGIAQSLQQIFDKYPTGCISGRIAPEKGIERFVAILPRVKERVGPFKLVVVGDGTYRQEVIAACQRYKLAYSDQPPFAETADVLFVGYQQNPYKFVGRSNLLLLPSLNEGMPNTIVEAMCLSVPVVAADCPYGPRELLSAAKTWTGTWPEFGAFGVLAPVLNGVDGEGDAWADAIAKVLFDKDMYASYAKRSHERSYDFSIDKNMLSWKEVLHSSL